jgi:hypothetical protein
LQGASNGGNLSSASSDSQSSTDYRIAAVDLFKSGKVREARKLLCNQVRADEIEEVFRWMYDNLELFSTTDEGQDRAIVIIRNGLVNHSMVADAEINLSACLVELAEINGNS